MVDKQPAQDITRAFPTSPKTIREPSPIYRIRPASSGSARSQQVKPSPAYLLEWNSQVSRRKFLDSVQELNEELEPRTSEEFHRLFVVHGLTLQFVELLVASLDIDPAFVEAHAGRRRYRPARARKDARFECYEYPELVKGYNPGGGRKLSQDSRAMDVMDDPPFHLMSGDGQAALFCRASLWMTEQASVLFLDRPMWRDPTCPLRKARRPPSVMKPHQPRYGLRQQGTGTADIGLSNAEEVQSLEDMLLKYCRESAEHLLESYMDVVKPGGLHGLPISDLAYEHWLDFFETLPPHSRQGATHDMMLFWQATESLEQNLDFSNYLRRHGKPSSDLDDIPNWQNLIDRIERRVNISVLHTPGITLTRAASTGLSTTSSSQDEDKGSPISHHLDNKEANQRSLDRVTYLGSVLLPFTVVSGVLSMNDQFMPNGNGFWIFWVASIASAGLCLLVIYLDQLRSLEVWFEFTANDAVEALFQPQRLMRTVAPPTVAVRTAADGTVLMQPIKDEAVDVPVPSKDGEMEMLADSPVNPTILVQRRTDGSRAKAWKKGQLGWGGAVKQTIGYYRWCAGTPVQFSPPGLERFRMKTI